MRSRWRCPRSGCCSMCCRRRPSRRPSRQARTFCGSSPRPPDPDRPDPIRSIRPPFPRAVQVRYHPLRCVDMRKERAAHGGRGPVAHTSETIGEEVRERLGQMTPSERRVARALLATYPSAGLESLPQLAESAGVTGPTVLRFVRKIGYDGYPDFQRSLRLEVQARTEGLYSLYETKVTAQDDLVVNR